MDAKSWNGDYDRPMDSSRGRITFGPTYICVDCAWKGRTPHDHHRDTGHAVRCKSWPADWPNAQFRDAAPDGRRIDRKRA